MKYSFINSARGIAIIMVIVVHISQLYYFRSELIKSLFDYGQMGVQLFFVASAYTLCLSSESRKDKKDEISNFYIRRFFRIFPIYYLGIVLYFILNFYFKNTDSYTLKNVFTNIIFVHGLIPSANNTIVPGGWSIGTEMLFYLVFPFLHRFLFSGYFAPKSIFIITLCYCTVYVLHIRIANNSFWYFNILLQLPIFIVGIFYFKYQHRLTLLYAIFIFTVFTFISFYLWHSKMFVFVPLASGISFCGLIKILEKTFINSIVFQKIGIVSYSIYISHFIFAFYFLGTVSRLRDVLLYILITIVFCYPLALLLEKYIENPFITLKA